MTKLEDTVNKYLTVLNFSPPLKDRTWEVISFYRDICSQDIKNVFITDYLDEENKQIFENLWLFSENNSMEAKDFISQDNFDFVPHKDKMTRWVIRKQDYDFIDTNSNSRLNINVSYSVLGEDITGNFKASGINCMYLKDIFMTYLMPNVIA